MESPLKNSRHERFSVLVASGMTQADAYREVYPQSRRWKDESVHERASKVSAKVLPRIEQLKQAVADGAVIERQEVVRLLADILRTPVGGLTADSPLCQEVEDISFGETSRRKVKMPSKLQAADILCKMLGFYAPQKVEGEIRFSPDEAVAARIGAEIVRARGKK